MITITLKVKSDVKTKQTTITKTISKNKPRKEEETATIVLNNALVELLKNLDK